MSLFQFREFERKGPSLSTSVSDTILADGCLSLLFDFVLYLTLDNNCLLMNVFNILYFYKPTFIKKRFYLPSRMVSTVEVKLLHRVVWYVINSAPIELLC